MTPPLRLILLLAANLMLVAHARAQVTVYDSLDTSAIAGYSEPNANNPIFGDALNLTLGGTADIFGLTVFNSSSGGNTGTIQMCDTLIKFYDNTIPYSGGALNNPLVATVDLVWDFTSGGGLPPGYYVTGTFDLSSLSFALPQNILVTQQFTETSGDSTRNGIVLFNNSPMGSSPNNIYINSAASAEGLYGFGGAAANAQIGYMLSVFPSSGGNHQPVADAQSVSLVQDTSANITLTGSDPDGDPITFTVVTSPTHGNLTGTAPVLAYQPNAGFIGSDSFTFKVNDGQTDSVPATVSLTINPTPTGLVIIPVWDSTITGDPNAAAIMNTINTAIQVYQTKFRDPVTVTIKFKEVGSGLGQSSTFFNQTTYANFINALTLDAKTTNDTVAIANLPGGSINPVDGSANIALTTANFRALGFNVIPPAGQPDSTIGLNMSIINITRTSINPNNYDLQAVVSHEIDEALGTSSGLGSANTRPVDLFRFDSLGNRNYTTSGDNAYFSLNAGFNDLVRYNQDPGGDYGDWWSVGAHTPRVQDAFGTPAATPNLGVELRVLDAIGWDLAPPAPPPVFQSVIQSNSTITFTWSAAYGRSYQVQYASNLSGTISWQNLGSPVIASGASASASDTIGPDPNRFYRVALLPQPEAAQTGLAHSGGQDSRVIGPLALDTRQFLPAPPSVPAQGAQSFSLPAPEPAKLWPHPVRLSLAPVK